MEFISQIFFSKKDSYPVLKCPFYLMPIAINDTTIYIQCNNDFVGKQWKPEPNLSLPHFHSNKVMFSIIPSIEEQKPTVLSQVVNSICMCKCHLCFNARKKIKSSSSSCQNKLQTVPLSNNPFTPKSDQHLISHCNITPKSLIKFPRIKEMITS